MNETRTAALAAHAAGLSVIPVRDDGSKSPRVSHLATYFERLATLDEIQQWYASNPRSGLAVVTGAVSGNLECLDFDDAAAYDAFVELAQASGLGALVTRIETGYLEATPNGGRHWLYRSAEVGSHFKLARRWKCKEETDHEQDRIKVLIETRGERGYVIVAPSNGRVHPSGGAYRLLAGGVESIATITPEERTELHSVARFLDAIPKDPPREPSTASADESAPGNDYNVRGDVFALLEAHGWVTVATRNGTTSLRRPGKSAGISATFGHAGTRYLYVFSSATVFEPERAYSPFAVYTILEHGGDFPAAASALRQQGYGASSLHQNLASGKDEQSEQPRPTVDPVIEPQASPSFELPIPLESGERPAFPVECLPRSIATWVTALALATQTPTALPAFQTIGALAIALAKRVSVEVRPGWIEPVNFYGVVALGSGNRKSAVTTAIGKPLAAFEAERATAMVLEVEQATARRETAEMRITWLKRQLASETDSDKSLALQSDLQDLVRQLLEDPSLQVPVPPRLLVDDTTPEKLSALMADHVGRMGVLSAEGGIFDIIAGRYSDSRTVSIDLFLKAHVGEDIPVDRVGRAAKHLRAPALTLAIAVQPEVLTGMAQRPGFRGRGLLARFAYAVPISTVGRRRIAAPPVPPDNEHQYDTLMRTILALPQQEEPLRLSDDASNAIMTFEHAIEPRLGQGGDLEHLADWGAKLAGLVARLAGLFHVVDHLHMVNGQVTLRSWQISTETMQAAIHIAEAFLIPHAKTAFLLMGADPALEQARRVLQLVANWPEDTISRRDVHQTLRATFPKPDDVNRPLALLAEHGYLDPVPVDASGPGRKPSPRFAINPLGRHQNPQNPHNSVGDRDCEDCEDSERQVHPSVEPGSQLPRMGESYRTWERL